MDDSDLDLPVLITDPLETALWIDALAERVPMRLVVPTPLDDLKDYLRRYRPRARA
ncbi:MAG TPA: hypothetical protein VLX92_33750 [Kofleriaceae bacterium]|nr:hypothetical protein [Kofleriaceae bacterium]